MSGDELRALAEAATPGEWLGLTFYANRGEVVIREVEPDEDAYPVTVARTETPHDAAFIAAANPTAVLALLDERDALRAQVERVRALADEWADPESADADITYGSASDDLRDALDPQ